MKFLRQLSAIFLILFASNVFAGDLVRWTGAEDQNGSLSHILEVLKAKTGQSFTEKDFILQDDRDLAFDHYRRFEQIVDGAPIEGKSIRVWTDLTTQAALQVEVAVESPTLVLNLKKMSKLKMSAEETNQIVSKIVKESDDPYLMGVTWTDKWVKGRLSRVVTVKGKHGKRQIVLGHGSHQVIRSEYREFPQSDDSVSIPALIYPIYEEVESGQILERQPGVLKNILPKTAQTHADLYAPMKTQKYMNDMYSPLKGETAEGRAQGYWSMSYLKAEAEKIREALPEVDNSFSNGLLLQGKYATINIHPDALTHFQGIDFTPAPSVAFFPGWTDVEMIPGSAFFGKPLFSAAEVLSRPARRLPDHNPAQYMNDGFDEIQVYYAINTLMESLQKNGFKDPDLSTRPFNAFLFNPDISYKDNAFYTDDTINFTTYSANQPNSARDNSTIWHELGHGVMDRLMGDNISLADTGGLSEGMADFVAALIIQDVTGGKPFPGSDQFRIINKTGFNLTNEVHDDGEAYGGAMKDFLDAVIQKDQVNGLHKVTDLILEAMRLSRDYPGLTAADWFNHILFADKLGRDGLRAPGELTPLLMDALNGRNFSLKGGEVATMKLLNDDGLQEIVSGSPGSRGHAVLTTIPVDGSANFGLSVSLKGTAEYSFDYPVTIKGYFNKNPLQGPIHWKDEEKGPITITMASEADVAHIPLTVSGKCDFSNQEDGSCVDFVYVEIFKKGQDHPSAKKRFYVRVKNP